MTRIMLAVVVLMAAAASAQIVQPDGPVTAWVSGQTCPAGWALMVPSQTRPADPERYLVTSPNALMNRAAVEYSFTVAGVLNQTALDAAIAAGTIRVRSGRPATVRCRWRPVGGEHG